MKLGLCQAWKITKYWRLVITVNLRRCIRSQLQIYCNKYLVLIPCCYHWCIVCKLWISLKLRKFLVFQTLLLWFMQSRAGLTKSDKMRMHDSQELFHEIDIWREEIARFVEFSSFSARFWGFSIKCRQNSKTNWWEKL